MKNREGPFVRNDWRAKLLRGFEGQMPPGLWERWNRLRAAWHFKCRLREVPKPFLVANSAWITQRDIDRGRELAKKFGWS